MKKYIPIDHPDWLFKLNFKCLKRPEMDVSIGRARILGECFQLSRSSKSLFHSSATLFCFIKHDCCFLKMNTLQSEWWRGWWVPSCRFLWSGQIEVKPGIIAHLATSVQYPLFTINPFTQDDVCSITLSPRDEQLAPVLIEVHAAMSGSIKIKEKREMSEYIQACKVRCRLKCCIHLDSTIVLSTWNRGACWHAAPSKLIDAQCDWSDNTGLLGNSQLDVTHAYETDYTIKQITLPVTLFRKSPIIGDWTKQYGN